MVISHFPKLGLSGKSIVNVNFVRCVFPLLRDDSNSESSSSSSSYQQNDESIKEAIRRAAEATGSYMKNQISSSNLKRITIDLSNDPDIRKYFESNIEENSAGEEDMDKTLNVTDSNKKEILTATLPLIDIFDEEISYVNEN
jgi:hypothetical protein